MTNREMMQHINKCAKAVKKEFKIVAPKDEKLVDINYGIPYVGINLPNGEEFFFQGEDARNLLEEATNTANKFQVSIEDALIWHSQSW